MMKLIFFLAVLVGGSYAAGARIHPDAVPAYFGRSVDGEYRKLDLTSGSTVVGQVVGETSSRVSLNLAGAIMDISKNDIVASHVITAADIESGVFDDYIVAPPKRPIITYDPELSITKRWAAVFDTSLRQKKAPPADIWRKPSQAAAGKPIPTITGAPGEKYEPRQWSKSGDYPAGSYGDMVQMVTSKEHALTAARANAEQLAGIPRNPFVEAFKNSSSEKKKTSASY